MWDFEDVGYGIQQFIPSPDVTVEWSMFISGRIDESNNFRDGCVIVSDAPDAEFRFRIAYVRLEVGLIFGVTWDRECFRYTPSELHQKLRDMRNV